MILKVHLANLYGQDKVSFDDRAAFVEKHLDQVRVHRPFDLFSVVNGRIHAALKGVERRRSESTSFAMLVYTTFTKQGYASYLMEELSSCEG